MWRLDTPVLGSIFGGIKNDKFLVLTFLFSWPFFKDVTLLLGWANEPVDGDVFQAEGNEVETCVHVLETYIFFLAWLEFKYVIWLIILGEGDPYSCCQQYGVCETICYFQQVFFKQEVKIFAWVRELFSTGGVGNMVFVRPYVTFNRFFSNRRLTFLLGFSSNLQQGFSHRPC